MNERLVLYDGHCALCDRTVRWLLRLDRQGHLRFAPLQGSTAAAVRQRRPGLAAIDSIVYLRRDETEERLSVESDAVLDILADLGVFRLAARMARLVPRRLRDLAYRAVARRRYRWFGRYETCRIPPAGDPRFLP
jgi:predicted DCC family thiol-disulfide oxidoreductase YuxK